MLDPESMNPDPNTDLSSGMFIPDSDFFPSRISDHGFNKNKNMGLRSGSVVDLGCLSRILIFIHPGSWIPDSRSINSNKRGGNFLFFLLF
jgi:hypothetical protein